MNCPRCAKLDALMFSLLTALDLGTWPPLEEWAKTYGVALSASLYMNARTEAIAFAIHIVKGEHSS